MFWQICSGDPPRAALQFRALLRPGCERLIVEVLGPAGLRSRPPQRLPLGPDTRARRRDRRIADGLPLPIPFLVSLLGG